jgi:hypothetical protein
MVDSSSDNLIEKGSIMSKLILALAVLCTVAGCASPGMGGSMTPDNDPLRTSYEKFQTPIP